MDKTLYEKLEDYINEVINNPKDFTPDVIIRELIQKNYLICTPQNLNIDEYNFLAEVLNQRYKELVNKKLLEPPKIIEEQK